MSYEKSKKMSYKKYIVSGIISNIIFFFVILLVIIILVLIFKEYVIDKFTWGNILRAVL